MGPAPRRAGAAPEPGAWREFHRRRDDYMRAGRLGPRPAARESTDDDHPDRRRFRRRASSDSSGISACGPAACCWSTRPSRTPARSTGARRDSSPPCARRWARAARSSCRACRPTTSARSIPRGRRAPTWESPPTPSGASTASRGARVRMRSRPPAPGPRQSRPPHPIDPPHGSDSPVGRARDNEAHVLLLGVGHDANTTIHLAENEAGVRYRRAVHVTVLARGRPVRFDYAEIDHCCARFAPRRRLAGSGRPAAPRPRAPTASPASPGRATSSLR